MSSTAVDLLIFGSTLLVVGSLIGFVIVRYWAQHVVFATKCEGEQTRAEIDAVRRWVEPEPEPPPPKRIMGLMPPMGPQ